MTDWRMDVREACNELWRSHLVVWSQGNASERVGPIMRIKASGIPCNEVLSDYGIVSVRLSTGEAIDTSVEQHGKIQKPSTDFETHRYIYNHIPEINAVVHTHSTFATAFAVAGIPVPCVATAMADEFGGDVPISAYCSIGDDSIGREIVRLYEVTGGRLAYLIRQHGPFCVGRSLEEAVKAAVMLEDCAKTIWHAMRLGTCYQLSHSEIEKNHKRYVGSYGQ